MMKKVLLFLLVLLITVPSFSQQLENTKIQDLIASYKNDIRGPYRDIRWFCNDGSLRQPKDPCPDKIGPGVQHARYKETIEALGKSNHIYLGQILSYTERDEFWDDQNNHSRLKQYQLDKYLQGIDDGWINQKGKFYRGAIQAEDEEAWGVAFYAWLLSNDTTIAKHYFLIRQSLKDVPHLGDDNLAQLIRSQSKVISDKFPSFMDLRIKIHGKPERGDISLVKAFKEKNTAKLSVALNKDLDELITTMRAFYEPIPTEALLKNTNLIKNTPIGKSIVGFIENKADTLSPSNLVIDASQLLFDIRSSLFEEIKPKARLQLLDISLQLEEIIFKNAPQWKAKNVDELLNKICYLGMASAGAGYLELKEWDAIKLSPPENPKNSVTLGQLTAFLETARRQVEWSSAMVKATYQPIVNQYADFEPLAQGFIDDKIRGSIALHLGKSVSDLGDFMAVASSLTNKVLDLPNQSGFRGLNPGYAYGELVVVPGSPDAIEVASDKIYVFQRPPSDLKPVAGIATVSEGNMVSHVQLLARNLGIPNVALADDNLENLLKYNGKKVFYAVSNKGNVILKLEKDMTDEERALFAKTQRKEEKIAVPIENIHLEETDILNLREVDASDSGKLCGPKAANLGQLKKMFSEDVVEGLVIPFGIFRSHMDQPMPNQTGSYWEFLTSMFASAENMRSENKAEPEVETYQLEQLAILREAIKQMPLQEEFISQLEDGFSSILGDSLGKVPVFLRSDTNMEDLKEFTGAGLNLTLFNVVDKAKILGGIKDVWASPYTERSFKWRQKYLSNPENVFPSILVIPSVDVDYSGVMITKGISSGNDNDLTVAFSRGAGGAVDGQAAETYLIQEDGGIQLLAPAREASFNRLPVMGGTQKQTATFEDFILNPGNIADIRQLAKEIRVRLPKETQSDYTGAYDVELGFLKDKLWLFQIRPFVENKKALSSNYLESITPKIDRNKVISLTQDIN